MSRNIKLILACGACLALGLAALFSGLRRAEEARAGAVTWPLVEELSLRDGYVRALSFLDERLALHPNDALLHYYRARLNFSRGEGPAALRDADRAIALGYAQEISHLLKALVHGRLYGDWKKQAELASRALTFDPTYADAYLIRAEGLYASGDHAGCARDAAAFARMEAASPDGWEYSLLCLEKLGDLAGAEAAGLKLLELRPSDHAALWRLGRIYAARGLHERALEKYSEAIRRSGGRPRYYLDRALSCEAEGDFSCAAWDYASAADWNEVSSYATHYLVLGAAMHRVGELGPGLEAAQKAVSLSPLSPAAYRLRARLRAETGDAAGARQDLGKMTALDPALDAEAAEISAALGAPASSRRSQ
jgi:tetratricopeptide (TPR) repeat protein